VSHIVPAAFHVGIALQVQWVLNDRKGGLCGGAVITAGKCEG